MLNQPSAGSYYPQNLRSLLAKVEALRPCCKSACQNSQTTARFSTISGVAGDVNECHPIAAPGPLRRRPRRA